MYIYAKIIHLPLNCVFKISFFSEITIKWGNSLAIKKFYNKV